MKKFDVRKLVAAALLAALACAGTFISIPYGIGYLNFGDCFVLLAGWLLGPLYGAFAGGIGPMLADAIMGYYVYAPATLVIKALMAVTAYFVAKAVTGKRFLTSIVSGVCAETVMVLGYFAYETILYGIGAATPGLLLNSIQGIAGIVCAVLLKEFNDRKRIWKY